MSSIGFTDEELEYPYDDTSVATAPGSLVLGVSTEEFDVSEMSQYLQDRMVVTAEEQDSEWNVAIRDIESFLPRVMTP